MSKMIKIKHPETNEVSVHSIQNANDLIQHLGYVRVSIVEVADGKPNQAMLPQEVIDNSKRVANLSSGAEESSPDGAIEEIPTEVMSADEVIKINSGSKNNKRSK